MLIGKRAIKKGPAKPKRTSTIAAVIADTKKTGDRSLPKRNRGKAGAKPAKKAAGKGRGKKWLIKYAKYWN